MQQTLLITRPKSQAERFSAAAMARFGDRLRPVISPILKIDATGEQFDLPPDGTVIFTSENAAALAPPGANGQIAWCVGERTAAAARARGYQAISGKGSAEDLLELILQNPSPGMFMHLRGEHQRFDISGALCKAGLLAKSTVTYTQAPVALTQDARDALDGDTPVILPLFSPRSAALFTRSYLPCRAPIKIAGLSEAVIEGINPSAATKLVVAQRADAASMLDAISILIDT